MTGLRLEDQQLITGRGRYVGDLTGPDTLACAFVRSPFAHGVVGSIDLEDAAAAPGVIGVFTAEDLQLPPIPGNTSRGEPAAENMVRPPLAIDRVRFSGDPIAVVVAETAARAADAAGLVWVDIEDLPPSSDPTAPPLFEGSPDNVVDTQSLSFGPETEASEISVTVDVRSQRLSAVTVEPLTVLARPANTGLEVWCGHQAPHRLADQLASLLSIDRAGVRVIAPHVGGAFGMKGMLFPEYVVVAALALRLDRAVSWIQSRREQFVGGTHGRAQRHRVTIEGDASGVARKLSIDQTADTGAYPHNGSMVPTFSRLVACGLYDFEAVDIDTRTEVSTRAPTGSYRGAGRPEAALAIERAMDAFGRAVDLDPFEVRLRNVVRSLPREMPTGAIYDSGDYAKALRVARDLTDVESVRSRQAAQSGTTKLVGMGVGAFVERAGGAADSWEYAHVEVGEGEIVVRTGSTEQGQGHETVWTAVTRDVFGEVPVRVVAGDTGAVASGIGTFASRSAQIGAAAVLRRSQAVLDEARQRAAEELEASADDLVYADGQFNVVGVPDAVVPLWALAHGDLHSDEQYSPGAQTFPYGVHVAVVEVDTETGEVELERIVAVDDCGTVLHPMIVEGQLIGSLAQGIGQALYEEVVYDDADQVTTATMVDYLTPRAADIPTIDTARLTHPAPSNPLGAKGAGEAGCIGGPPAILNAVIDALAPLGVTDLQLPLRPQSVWQAINEARSDVSRS